MNNPRPDYDSVKKRLDDELAAGKTVVLGTAELDDPDVRLRLPQLLEQLALTHRRESLSPLKLRGYTLLGEIGRGGMSTVHLARHEALGRTVAVKVTPNWLASDPRSRDRLVREARSLALVSHPNIVRVYDVIDNDDAFAIAMEWVDGHTLARLILALPVTPGTDDMAALMGKLGTPPQHAVALEATTTRTFARMMRDIALATQAVHDAGLLHLDIKPSNVLVRRDGTPLLADFGVVRELAAEQTHTQTFAGTPIYAAPEQLRRDDAQIGPHTDVYAIGLTLYELLAREQPLRDLDLASIAKTVESGRFPPLSTFAEVPVDLTNIVQKAIAPEPENRYASAAALAADLTAFLEDRPVVARPLSRTQRLRRWMRSEPWKATLAAALLVLIPVLLGLGGYLAVQWPALERLQAAAKQAEASRLKNEAFQSLLFLHADEANNDALLAKAAALEDGATAAACRLLYANHTNSRATPDRLAECVRRAPDNLALRLFTGRQAEERIYFDEAEAEQLRRSADPLDHYVLAIDRVLLAFDAQRQHLHAAAATDLEHALLIDGPDELLHGLLVWACNHQEDTDRIRRANRALERLWPDNLTALTWLCGSQVDAGSPEAAANLQRLEDLAPGSVEAFTLRMRQSLLARQWQNVATLWDRARRAGVTSPAMQNLGLRAACNSWAKPTMATFAELMPKWVTPYCAVSSVIATRPHRTMHLIESMLEHGRSASEVEAMYFACREQGHEKALLRLQDHILEQMPDRRMLDIDLMQRVMSDMVKTQHTTGVARHLQLATRIARRWRPNRDDCDSAPVQMITLATARDWPALTDAARYWFDMSTGEDRRHAACYVALAESRLGNYEAAAEFSGIALSAQLGQTVWTNALLEAAWLLVARETPPEMHDRDVAMHYMELFQFRNKDGSPPFKGPWVNCVQAYVYGANKDKDPSYKVHAQDLVDHALNAMDRGRLDPGAPDAKLVREQLEWLDKWLKKH
ncbi:MAG: serine/threonine-protein kinase [Planctomycetota bacterium]